VQPFYLLDTVELS